MHPMRKANRELADRAEVDAVFLAADHLVLALADEGAPYPVPMNFGYDGRTLYLHCALEGRKLDLLRARPEVGFCAVAWREVHGLEGERACEATCSYASVIGAGRARVLADPAERHAGLKLLMAHYSDREYGFSEAALAKTAVVAVDVEWITAKRNDRRPRA